MMEISTSRSPWAHGCRPCPRETDRGLTLLEVVVALGIIVVAFGSISLFAGRSVTAARTARHDLIAANLALEGMEIIRNARDTNWIQGRTEDSDGTLCGPGPVPEGTDGTWRQGLCNCTAPCAYRVDANPQGGSPTIFRDPSGATRNQLLSLDPSTGVYSYAAGGTTTPFRRWVELSEGAGLSAATTMQVVVTVAWCPTETSSCSNPRMLVLEDRLRNWLPR